MKRISNNEKNISADIEKISNSHYIMNYHGDYGLDEYLTKGVNSLDEYLDFVERRLIMDGNAPKNWNSFGCAAFLARNTDNDIIMGRNMDCECGVAMLTRLNEGKPYHSISLTNMAELDWDDSTYDSLEQDSKYTLAAPYSPSDGINEYGLAVATLSDSEAVYPSNRKITLLDMSIPRLILDRARDVEEAIKLVQNYNMFYIVSPLHYMVTDANGNSAVIEFVKGEMVVTRIQGNYQVVTNFTLHNNEELAGFGKDRYENIEAKLKECGGVISEENALELLKNNVIKGDEQYSAVYNLTKKSISISFAKEYESVYKYQL